MEDVISEVRVCRGRRNSDFGVPEWLRWVTWRQNGRTFTNPSTGRRSDPRQSLRSLDKTRASGNDAIKSD